MADLVLKPEAMPPRIPDDLWNKLAGIGTAVHYSSGQTIYSQDTVNNGILCIIKGRVKLFQILDDGTEAMLSFYSDHCLFGEATALGEDVGNPQAVAVTEVFAILITTPKVHDLIVNCPEFAQFMIKNLVHKLKASTIQLSYITGKRVFARLCNALLMLDYYGIPKSGSESWYDITHQQLSSLIDTTRSNVTAMVSRLCQENLIEHKRNRLRIINPSGLREIAKSPE